MPAGLPFTFGLDPLQGLAAMTRVYVGGSAGGLITATLLGIPVRRDPGRPISTAACKKNPRSPKAPRISSP